MCLASDSFKWQVKPNLNNLHTNLPLSADEIPLRVVHFLLVMITFCSKTLLRYLGRFNDWSTFCNIITRVRGQPIKRLTLSGITTYLMPATYCASRPTLWSRCYFRRFRFELFIKIMWIRVAEEFKPAEAAVSSSGRQIYRLYTMPFYTWG